jgi:hypothetical protein
MKSPTQLNSKLQCQTESVHLHNILASTKFNKNLFVGVKSDFGGQETGDTPPTVPVIHSLQVYIHIHTVEWSEQLLVDAYTYLSIDNKVFIFKVLLSSTRRNSSSQHMRLKPSSWSWSRA